MIMSAIKRSRIAAKKYFFMAAFISTNGIPGDAIQRLKNSTDLSYLFGGQNV